MENRRKTPHICKKMCPHFSLRHLNGESPYYLEGIHAVCETRNLVVVDHEDAFWLTDPPDDCPYGLEHLMTSEGRDYPDGWE